MTSPQPTPPPDQGLSDAEQAALGALTTFLGEAALVGSIALPPYLLAKLLRLGLRRDAIRAAAAIALRPPLFRRAAVHGTATAQVAAQEPEMRARYILAAATRITRDLRTVVPTKPGQPKPTLVERVEDAVRRETAWWRAHVDAQRNRREAAEAADQAARVSPWLRWTTRGDTRVEADCQRLAGAVFTVDDPPRLHGLPVYPGAVHPRCRCTAQPVVDPTLFGRQTTVTTS